MERFIFVSHIGIPTLVKEWGNEIWAFKPNNNGGWMSQRPLSEAEVEWFQQYAITKDEELLYPPVYEH